MPKSQEQNKAIREKKRQEIKEKALRLFAIQGYDAVSVDDICKNAKCAHGLFYHYYASKEELFSALIKDMEADLLSYQEAKSEPGFSGLKLLLVQITDALQERLSNKVAFLLIQLTFEDQEGLQKPNYKKVFRFRQIAKEKIKEGQREGSLLGGDPEEILNALVALLKDQLATKLSDKKKGYKYLSEDVLVQLVQKSAKF
ncbi:MAG: TetR/AcrR family transcriptional regulator [Bacilli bacterium]|nr:TetR/AcrR family transcriptional regulator [Bacilli bacterium]